MTSNVTQEKVYELLDRWESESDYGRRGDYVLALQDIADTHPEFAEEIRAAGIPGVEVP